MYDPTPHHSAIFARDLALDLMKQGFDKSDILSGTGLTLRLLNEDRPVAAFPSIAALFERAAKLTGNDAFGFERGQHSELKRSGLFCYVGRTAPTVRDFLVSITRFRRVYSDVIEMSVDRLQGEGILEWDYAVPSTVPARQYCEFGVAGLVGAVRRSVNRMIRLPRVAFHHSRNTRLGVFRSYLGGDVLFSAPRNQLQFDLSDLELPLVTADDQLHAVLVQYGEEVLARKSVGKSDLALVVEKTIADGIVSGRANQDQIARDLGMSSRTLSRKLSQQGTSFAQLLGDFRLAMARRYLHDSDLSLTEISYLLGYSRLSSFSDAFKRQTGQTPGQFRAAA